MAALLIRDGNQPPTYLVNDGGYKCHIPDPATYHNLFANDPTLTLTPEVPDIADGPAITPGAILARAKGANEIYLISNKVKRHIATNKVLHKYQFEGKVVDVPPVLLDIIESGPELTWPSE